MKFKMDPRLPSRERELLSKAFRLLARRLGINEYDKTVDVTVAHLLQGNPDEKAYIVPSFNQHFQQGKAPRRYDLGLKIQGMPHMIASLAHELKHLQQWCTGQLGIGFDLYGRPKQLFYGVMIDRNEIPYRQQPWEREAYECMYPLAHWAIDQMIKEDPTCRNDIMKGTGLDLW